jgi:hypothetical protein
MSERADVTEYRVEFPRADGSRGFEIFGTYDAARTAARWTIERAPSPSASATVCGVRWNGHALFYRTFRKP